MADFLTSPLQTDARPQRVRYDAVVVGSGPNGLAAAITLAERGLSVVVLEGKGTIGGGMRTAELTLPGFRHDICSAIHPLGIASPFFRGVPLQDFGLEWIQPEIAVAHPVGDTAAVADPDLEVTLSSLGPDGEAYRRLVMPLGRRIDDLLPQFLGPLRPPRHPLLMARFGLKAIRSAESLARGRFQGEPARGLVAGMAAHSVLPLDRPGTAAFALMFFITAAVGGWPYPRGGAQRIAEAMGRYLQSLGGELVTGHFVRSLGDLPQAGAVLLDTSPRQLLSIVGDRLPRRYRGWLEGFRHSPAVFKVDWALDGPIPWISRVCRKAGTVHVGGTFDEVAASETSAWGREPAQRPFVLVTQQSLGDNSRAPQGKHTGWGYCHVPRGSRVDMTERIEAQIERFAPGFRDLILARHVMRPSDFERHNANYLGGDITGGAMDLWQLFARPAPSLDPYASPLRDVYICSASTPPGGGVHGMCGYHAARSALRRSFPTR